MNAPTETRASCRDTFFTTSEAQNQTIRIYHGCSTHLACLDETMEQRIEDRVWGGMTVRQRRALRKKHGDAWCTALTIVDKS